MKAFADDISSVAQMVQFPFDLVEIIVGNEENTGYQHFFLSQGHEHFPKQQILDSFKLKAFVDDNFKFDENDRKFQKR